MKKYFSRILLASFILVSVFGLGSFINSTPVSAMNNCQFIEVLFSSGIIRPEKVDAIRISYGCTPVATPPATTPGDNSLQVSCRANKDAAKVYELVSWTATVNGGTGSTTYSWSGTDNLSGNSSSTLKSYTSSGVKTASVTVTKGQSSKTASCNLTLTQTVKYPGGFMPVGATLGKGQIMDSKNGIYRLITHDNGNVVLYAADKVVWQTGTAGPTLGLTIQNDGNLLVYGRKITDDVLWATMKFGDPFGLTLQNDGNLVVYTKDLANIIWSSNTQNTSGPIVPQTPHNVASTTVVNPENVCIFDPVKYSNFYPDIKKAYKNDIVFIKWHWKNYGISEGRTPCGADRPTCSFVESEYLRINPDIAATASANTTKTGLDHYKKLGINEGRVVCKN